MDSRLRPRGRGSSVLRARMYFGTRSFCEHMNLVSQVCRLTGNRELVFLFGYILGMKECYMDSMEMFSFRSAEGKV